MSWLADLTGVAAIHLFVERATAANTTFVLTEGQVDAVITICHHVDGFPLAIELAAARTRILSPSALLLRLVQRLPALIGGARDLPVRQQTLRATIDWSYHLLTPADQRLFGRLAVFVGGWTLEAAVAVCENDDDPGGEVVDRLQALLDNSLILQTARPDGTSRFRAREAVSLYPDAARQIQDQVR